MAVLRALTWLLGCDLALQLAAAGTSVKLNNGIEMPLVAFGANVYPTATCKQATLWALQAGIRFVWSSAIIGKPCQVAQKEAIDASGTPRAEIFLAGTVDTQSCTDGDDCYEKTKSGAEDQIAIFGGVLDMLMLDYPASSGCEGVKGQWRALDELYAQKKVKSIAVSNFEAAELQCLEKSGSGTTPVANQLKYHVGAASCSELSDNKGRGIVVQAYSPLGMGSVLQQEALAKIGAAHGKSSAQVALRWLIQQGIAVNVASTKLEHFQEDIGIFDFQLSDPEMRELGACNSSTAATSAAPGAAAAAPAALLFPQQ